VARCTFSLDWRLGVSQSRSGHSGGWEKSPCRPSHSHFTANNPWNRPFVLYCRASAPGTDCASWRGYTTRDSFCLKVLSCWSSTRCSGRGNGAAGTPSPTRSVLWGIVFSDRDPSFEAKWLAGTGIPVDLPKHHTTRACKWNKGKTPRFLDRSTMLEARQVCAVALWPIVNQSVIHCYQYHKLRRWGSSISVVSDYRLDDRGLILGRCKAFFL
jgi:hypothetical protein